MRSFEIKIWLKIVSTCYFLSKQTEKQNEALGQFSLKALSGRT